MPVFDKCSAFGGLLRIELLALEAIKRYLLRNSALIGAFTTGTVTVL